MTSSFNLDEARRALAELLPSLDEAIGLRAELTEAVTGRQRGDDSIPLADVKALEARVGEILDRVRSRDIQVKGFAPLLLDFPIVSGGRELLGCWLESERELDWYHDGMLGFAGRRRIAELEASEQQDSSS